MVSGINEILQDKERLFKKDTKIGQSKIAKQWKIDQKAKYDITASSVQQNNIKQDYFVWDGKLNIVLGKIIPKIRDQFFEVLRPKLEIHPNFLENH